MTETCMRETYPENGPHLNWGTACTEDNRANSQTIKCDKVSRLRLSFLRALATRIRSPVMRAPMTRLVFVHLLFLLFACRTPHAFEASSQTARSESQVAASALESGGHVGCAVGYGVSIPRELLER